MNTTQFCTRKAKRYYLNKKISNHDSELINNPHIHMLIEDLRIGIMPIGGKSSNSNFIVKVITNDKDAEEIIRKGLYTPRIGEARDITEGVCNFIKQVTNTLAYHGKTYYEIIYFYNDKNKLEYFQLDEIIAVKNILGSYWQFIPRKAEIIGQKQQKSHKLIRLPKKNILTFSIPKELGGTKKFKKLLKDFNSLQTIPKFAKNDLKLLHQTPGFDLSKYSEQQKLILAKNTKHLGWKRISLISDSSLEFYQIYKLLQFEKTRAILREHIINELNKGLNVTGNKMGFNAEIQIKGLISAKDYDNYIKQMLNGQLQFSEAIKIIRM